MNPVSDADEVWISFIEECVADEVGNLFLGQLAGNSLAFAYQLQSFCNSGNKSFLLV